MTAYGDVLWSPDAARIDRARLTAFIRWLRNERGVMLPAPTAARAAEAFEALHAWSLRETGAFWDAVATFTGVIFQTPAATPFRPPPAGKMRGARWFDGARLNFAENLLTPGAGDDVAIVAHAEGMPRRTLTRAALRRDVARAAAALAAAGVGPGDRVAGVLVNGVEGVVAMLGAATLGAVWSSCSPDFGAGAIVDRLSQVQPKVVFATPTYRYGGKICDVRPTVRDAVAKLPGAPRVVVVPHLEGDAAQDGELGWDAFLSSGRGAVPFAALPFDAPLYIMFSSGTTGVPKCITHGVGGTLLQHQKELALHTDLGPGAKLLYYTTLGWMMWNWMVSALATGATIVLFDGAVTYPDGGVLWRVVQDEGVTAFGTSPKFLATCMGGGVQPSRILEGAALRTVLSTGSPLLPEQAAWVAREAPGVHLASISGGTDIVSCFMLGTPLLPVRAGEIQHAGLGMAIDAWDEDGRSVRGTKGELVCTQPFPSMPVGFWNDPDGAKYDAAYFSHFTALGREVWRHGDFIEITETGGVVVYGRSDATLNPGGVRIGTAELYRQIESLPEVVDAIAVGQRDGDDTVIVLFVKLQEGLKLDDALTKKIKLHLRTTLTPRHVPKTVAQVRDVPYTRSGKKVELAVTQAIHGEPVKNMAALANPEAMDDYVAFAARPRA